MDWKKKTSTCRSRYKAERRETKNYGAPTESLAPRLF
jgi:hypothetical protein